jgi:bacterial leucyl aminopeptidase
MVTAFFDVGDTLANVTITEQAVRLSVLPGAREALGELKHQNIPAGIISDPGNLDQALVEAALRECGLYDLLDPKLIVFGRKNGPAIFIAAAEAARISPGQCVFTGESPRERTFALQAGYLAVSPHPLLTPAVVRGEKLTYAAVTLTNDDEFRRWLASEPARDMVPLRVAGGAQRVVYVICTLKAVQSLRSANISVRVLGESDRPLQTDLYLVRDDRPKPPGFASREEHSRSFLEQQNKGDLIVDSTTEGVYLAIPWDQSIENVHFPGALHGHNDKLSPDPSVLDPFRVAPGARFAGPGPATTLSEAALQAVRTITPDLIKEMHQRYVGAAPLNGNKITSRHIRHPDNRQVTLALAEHFKQVAGADARVGFHRFRHEDLELYNVVAEMGGATDSLVLVTAHLDSTGAFSDSPYDPAADPAPGADDDASGIAAVLAVAAVAARLRTSGSMNKTLRFVLFNAEEHGLVGSKAYSRTIAAERADVVAVLQMDMIGYRKPFQGEGSPPPGEVEVHAGAPGLPEVQARSLALGDILRQVKPLIASNLSDPQIYPDAASGASDPAAGRSDHSPFQERGYAACVVCEDFFPGPKPDSPEPAPNPNYHKPSDLKVDYAYAAEIARLVAAAAIAAAGYA